MKYLSLLLFGLLWTLSLRTNAQTIPIYEPETPTIEYLESLFWCGATFEEITTTAELHFATKFPGVRAADLCSGEHRDGDFVKYNRWKAFWKHHLMPDGTLGDFTHHRRVAAKSNNDLCEGEEWPAEWANPNYTANMGYQIDQGRTSAMAFHPTDPAVFFVGAAFGGLWKTTDGGLSYTLLNDELPLAAVSGIAIHPANPDQMAISLGDILQYGAPGIGVFVSEDGGETFSPTNLAWALTDNIRVHYMDQDPNDGATIIIATGDGLYKTSDFFTTSTLVHSGNMRHVTFSQSTPDLVFAGSADGAFYRSTDGGDSFTLVSDFGAGQIRIAVPLVQGSQHVVATHGTTLQRSIDNGQTFTSYSLPESNMVIAFSPGSDMVLNGGNFEAYRSDDFGTTFYPVSDWLGNFGLPFIHVDQRNVFVNPLISDKVYYCNDGGIFSYDNVTDAFQNLSSDLIITQYYDIAVSQSDELVLGGGSQDNGNVFRESDGTWNRYAQTGDGMGQEIDPFDSQTRYWSYQNGSMRRWKSGNNTAISPPGLDGTGAWETPFKLDPNNANRIVAGYNAVWASDDQGNNWTQIGDDILSTSNLHQIAIAASNSDKIYVTRGSQLYEKELGTDAWIFHFTPSNQHITDLEVDPNNEEIIYISYSGYNDGDKVFRSEDAGATWTNISLNLPNLPIMSLELYETEDGGIFIGTYGAVYYKNGTDQEWRKFGCLPNTSVNDIEIQYFTNKIFIGTHGRGIFEAEILFEPTTHAQDAQALPQELMAYPNPTTGTVTIQHLGAFEVTSLEIYDVKGRVISAPYQSIKSGVIKVDCSGFTPGQYFVRLRDRKGVQKICRINVQ